VEQSPSEADSHSSTQEIARLLWSPKVHYRVHNSTPLVPEPDESSPHFPTLTLFP